MQSSYVAFSLVPRDYARPHALLARQNSSIDPSELPAQCQSSCTTTVNLFSVRLYVFPSPIFLISYILLCLFIHVYPPIHSLNLQLVPWQLYFTLECWNLDFLTDQSRAWFGLILGHIHTHSHALNRPAYARTLTAKKSQLVWIVSLVLRVVIPRGMRRVPSMVSFSLFAFIFWSLYLNLFRFQPSMCRNRYHVY